MLNKKKQSLESYVDKEIVNQFFDYYKSKMQFIIIPHKEKLQNKLKTIYFKTYNKTMEIDRYREDVNITKDHISKRVNTPNLNTQVIEPFNNTSDKWCVNVSDIELPTYVTDVLKLGEKFNFNSRFNNSLTLHYLKNFEMFVNNNIKEEQIPKLRGTFLIFINKFYNKELSHNTHFDKKLKIDLKKKTKEFIKSNPRLLITRADKGNTTIIIRKLNYIEKTEKLLFR